MARNSTAVDFNSELIRVMLKDKGMTLVDLAEKLGNTRQHLSRVLNEHSPMARALLNKIAVELGVSSEKLLKSDTQLFVGWMRTKLHEAMLSDAIVEPGTRAFTELVTLAIEFGILQPDTKPVDADDEVGGSPFHALMDDDAEATDADTA